VCFCDLLHDEQPGAASLNSGFVGALLLESRAIRDVAATPPSWSRQHKAMASMQSVAKACCPAASVFERFA
tara:strand:- start:3394 stop:3606 length:213 start_codon:yes stop_codon:yes gene_type:complete